MKELFILCYDYCDDGNVCPELQQTALALLRYFSGQPHKVICSPLVFPQLQGCAGIHKSIEQSTYLEQHCRYIPSFFEKELLLPEPFVVLVMDKEAAKSLFSYIDPYVLERQWSQTGQLELFHITCESDHIGTEWIWQGVEALTVYS